MALDVGMKELKHQVGTRGRPGRSLLSTIEFIDLARFAILYTTLTILDRTQRKPLSIIPRGTQEGRETERSISKRYVFPIQANIMHLLSQQRQSQGLQRSESGQMKRSRDGKWDGEWTGKGLGRDWVRTVLFRLSADSVEIVGTAAMAACYQSNEGEHCFQASSNCGYSPRA